MKVWMLVLTMSFFSWLQAVPTFVSGNPTLTQVSGTWTVDFTLSESTDVEISIVNVADSSVVRHLAAGKLGAGAPAPLVKSSLHQTVTWDGKDDLGRPVTVGASIRVRVRAGMSARLDKIADRGEKGQNSAYTSVLPNLGLSMSPATNELIVVNETNTGWPHGPGQLAIRAYDATTGDYRRTLFPFAPGLDKASVQPYGINDLGGSLYQTKTVFLPYPILSFRPITPLPNISGSGLKLAMAPVPVDNKFFLCNLPYSSNNVMGFVEMAGNGTYQSAGSLPFVTSPALPAHATHAGPVYFYPHPNGAHMLMSGFYAMRTVDTMPQDTGFWRDGCVYKINRTTGVATILISLPADSLPKTKADRRTAIGPAAGHVCTYAAIHGIAADNAGHLFICDRLHNQIGIYDTAGAFIKALPFSRPDLVAVNSATGEVYAASRHFLTSGTTVNTSVTITKFSDWRGVSPAVAATLNLAFVSYLHPTYLQVLASKAHLALNTQGAAPILWWTLGKKHIVGIRDDGAALTQFKNFADSSNLKLMNYDRLAVDRRKETVYLQNGWSGISKIEDWTNPVIVQCSTTAGKALLGGDMNICPQGYLYVRRSNGANSTIAGWGGGWSGPIERFNTDHRHAPVRFAGRDTNQVYFYQGKYGAGFADRGFDISVHGKVAVQDKHSGRWVQLVDTNATKLDDSLICPLPGNNSGGLKFDRQGNLYLGVLMRPAGHVKPAGFETDTAYNVSVGSIVKWPAYQRGSVTGTSVSNRVAVNATHVYANAGLSPFSGSHPMSGSIVCICRFPKFDVDPYGRLFVPNAITGKVTVLDNDDNVILRMGEYGNYDSKGPGIPLIWPVGAASSEDFIYITDMVNERLLRVRMDYTLDNYPGLTLKMGSEDAELRLPEGASVKLATAPNPFSGTSRVAFALSGRSPVTLSVHDLSGRLVNRLVSGVRNAGVHSVRWNGRDPAGRAVAPGVYVYRLEADGRVLTCRAILVK